MDLLSLPLIDLSSEDDSLLLLSSSDLDTWDRLPFIDLSSDDDSLLIPSSFDRLRHHQSSASQVEHTSQNKMKPISKPLSSSKSHGISKQVLEKGVARNGVQNSSLKPPKILQWVSPFSKPTTKKHAAFSSATPIAIPRSIPSLKPSSGSYSSTKTLTTTPSSHNRSDNTKNLRNRADSRNANLFSTDSIMKTPLRVSRNKTQSRNSNSSAYLMSPSKFSSSISSISSKKPVSGVTSTEIPSSIPSLKSSSSGSPSSTKTLPTAPFSRWLRDVLVAGFQSQCDERASLETRILSYQAAESSHRSCISSNLRPSRLRMPSPRIGFFDWEPTSNGTGLLKNACGICNLDEAIKQRTCKLQDARPLTQIEIFC